MESDNVISGYSEPELDPEVCSLYITYSLVVDGYTSREFLQALSKVAARDDAGFHDEIRSSFVDLLRHYELHRDEVRADIDPKIGLDHIREAHRRYEKALRVHQEGRGAEIEDPAIWTP